MYWYNKGFHFEKPHESAVKLTNAEYDQLMEDIGNGATLKEKDGKPYAAKTQAYHDNVLFNLRFSRELHCFPIINRGAPWYNTLTEEQKQELQTWYQAWLDVTETKVKPENPSWLKE